MAWKRKGTSEWQTFNRIIIHDVPDAMGIYELAGEGKIILGYGCGILRIKLMNILSRHDSLLISFFRYDVNDDEEECYLICKQLIDKYKREFGEVPHFNEE